MKPLKPKFGFNVVSETELQFQRFQCGSDETIETEIRFQTCSETELRFQWFQRSSSIETETGETEPYNPCTAFKRAESGCETETDSLKPN